VKTHPLYFQTLISTCAQTSPLDDK